MRVLLAILAVAFPANAAFDYQIGGDYPLPDGVTVVARDVDDGTPADGAFNICYVNGFQTQPGRRDEWPARVVLDRIDPGWPDEYLLDLSTRAKRATAARVVARMTDTCAAKGFQAVEYDNLDSWTRLKRLPFGRRAALDFARRLAQHAHARGLLVGQKNTAQLTRAEVRRVGFDFAMVEQCGRYRECERYQRLHGANFIDAEYSRTGFRRACDAVGDDVAVVLRDVNVSTPGKRPYVFDSC